MHILVIGGTGFIGRYAVRALVERGHRVTVFHRGETTTELPEGVAAVRGDRRAIGEHTAALRALAPDAVLDTVAYQESEVRATQAALQGSVARYVLLSSEDVYRARDGLFRVYQGPPDPVPLDEDAPLREVPFPYRAMAAGETDMRWGYDKIPVERAVLEGVAGAGTVLRLPAVYGPDDPKHRLHPYLRRMDDARPAVLLDALGAAWRWTRGYVENVADAIALATTDPRACGRVYNVGEPDALAERDWVRAIGAAVGWRGRVATLPAEKLPAHLREVDYDFRHHWEIDTGRLRAELGYRERVGRNEGLARTVAWERANPPAKDDPRDFDYAAEDAALESAR